MWEYRFRKVEDSQVTQETGLGKFGPSDLIETEVNKLASEGWELMPVTLQTARGYFLLVFKQERAEDAGGEGLMM